MQRGIRVLLFAGIVGSALGCADVNPVGPDASFTTSADGGGDARAAAARRPGFDLLPLPFGRAGAALQCLDEGTPFGDWQVRYHGYGCVGVEPLEGVAVLFMTPTEAVAGSDTHAPLTLGPAQASFFTATARFETLWQTRLDGAPNPWEVAWMVWHYQDDEHFYYFIPKPNGWELGKRDPAYPGGQRFLATGTDRVYPIGRRYAVTVQQRGTLMTVHVDGEQVVQFRDRERPYTAGRLALYSEDAAIRVHEVASR